MYNLGILGTHPDCEGFAKRAGRAFTAQGSMLAVMNGVREWAKEYKPETRVAMGEHWVLWREDDDGPTVEEATRMVEEASNG